MERKFKYKFLLIVLLGIFISSVSVSASIRLMASEVSYDNTKSNLTSNDIQLAIDELNNKLKNELVAVENACPEGYECLGPWNFDYTGNEQKFLAPLDGVYIIETWGAQGGQIENENTHNGGYGGYSKGYIKLTDTQPIYIYVGGKGEFQLTDNTKPGYNGGSGGYHYDSYASSGGGATDVRLVNGEWNDFNSLKSRIMVAAGGGGSLNENEAGSGGGLLGYSAGVIDDSNGYAIGATQTMGGTHTGNYAGFVGYFGYSEHWTNDNGGGGGGYYGGMSGVGYHRSGSGGSSFISGHDGCDAITESSVDSNIVHTGQSIHYSGYKFTNTEMIDGAGYNWTNVKGDYVGQPQPDGTISVGHTGNGYARISYYSR